MKRNKKQQTDLPLTRKKIKINRQSKKDKKITNLKLDQQKKFGLNFLVPKKKFKKLTKKDFNPSIMHRFDMTIFSVVSSHRLSPSLKEIRQFIRNRKFTLNSKKEVRPNRMTCENDLIGRDFSVFNKNNKKDRRTTKNFAIDQTKII